MAYFPDLSICNYLPYKPDADTLAVGWLEPRQAFQRGEVKKEFFEKLCQLLTNPWRPPFISPGIHQCGFCRFSGGPSTVVYKGFRFSGISNGCLFVPHGKKLYISPLSIAHYVDAHEYVPPEEYQQAVLDCPEMRSPSYLKALLQTSAREMTKSATI